MGFRDGAYATVWEITDEGKYASVRLSISRKDKQSGEYKTDFNSIVRFVGDAYQKIKGNPSRTRIRLGSCDTTNKYDKEKEKLYTNYTVFDCEIVNGQPKQEDSNNLASTEPVENDEDLPF